MKSIFQINNTTTMVHSTFAKLLVIFTSYFFSISLFFHLIVALVLFDFITGIWQAVVAAGTWKTLKIPFTNKTFRLPIAGIKSRIMKRSVIKLTCYIIAIMVTFMFEKTILGSGIIVTQFITGMIALVEIASIFENLAKLTGMHLFLKLYETLATYFNKNKNIINKIDGLKEDSDTPETDSNTSGTDSNTSQSDSNTSGTDK